MTKICLKTIIGHVLVLNAFVKLAPGNLMLNNNNKNQGKRIYMYRFKHE